MQYCKAKKFELRIYVESNLSITQKNNANLWYIKFYKEFTDYLYDELHYFDNYVGLIIKCYKTFMNHLELERQIPIGNFLRHFHVPSEIVQMIAFKPDQLQYIIHSKELLEKLDERMKRIRDIFIFGCTVALRVSDLLKLTMKDITIRHDDYFLNVKSQKTKAQISIKLPPYAVEIIKRYDGKYPKLLPTFNISSLNQDLKTFAKHLPDDFIYPKARERRGQPIIIYKNEELKTHFHISDHICTHTMRRTSITTMLMLGAPEHIVRQMSGHSPNSKEFFRYVQLSQEYMNEETDRAFNKLCEWNPYKGWGNK